MRTTILLLAFFYAFIANTTLFAQLNIGQWRVHLSYNNATALAQTPNKVFVVSGGLFSVDKTTGNIETYDKVKGLSDVLISKIKYDPQTEVLLIAYQNGNIDLLTNSGIVNISDYYDKPMTVSKKINDINIYNSKAFLSCDFGVIIIDLKRKEIKETCYIGDNAEEVIVLNTTVNNDSIYALVHQKLIGSAKKEFQILSAPLNSSNLQNYEVWENLTILPFNNNKTKNYQRIFSFSNKLFLHAENSFFIKEGSVWKAFQETEKYSVLSVSGKNLITVSTKGNVSVVNDKLENFVEFERKAKINSIEYDEESKKVWLAAGAEGLFAYSIINNSEEKFSVNSPATSDAWDMVFAGEKLFVVPGGRWYDSYRRPGRVMIYENGIWRNIDHKEIVDATKTACRDFVSIAVDPFDKSHFFSTSYGTGLYEFRENKFHKRYHCENSPIVVSAGAKNANNIYQRTDGALFDEKGNLWFLNDYSKSIKVLMRDGVWNELSFDDFDNLQSLRKILISNQNPNKKWAFCERMDNHRRLFVFDDNGTISDQSDDKSKVFTSFINSDNPTESLTPAFYHSIAQEKNGTIWLGTDIGPLIFYNPERVFEEGYTCSRIKIPRNDGSDLADYLLENEAISAIAIDGANRKWLGTKGSGVFLVSENGEETIHHFTSKNSPLLDDEIFSIAINPKTGEVFIATAAGIVSFQSDASVGEESFDKLYAFPNPVRESYKGDVTIKGLLDNTTVKITDVNGNLISETISKGSIATWNVSDAYGKKVATGVYFAICLSQNGTQSKTIKILVIN